MAITCPACGAENRSVAKFCIECVTALPADFAATQVLTVAAHAQVSLGEETMPTALAAFAAAPAPPVPSMPHAAVATADWATSKPASSGQGMGFGVGIGVGVAIFALLVAGAVGWLAAGGEIWPSRDDRTASAQASQREAAPALAAAPAAAGVAAAAPVAVEPTLVPVPVAVESGAAADPEAARINAMTATTMAASGASSVSSPASSAATAATPKAGAAKPERSQNFLARCEGLGFLATPRCRVEVCEQPSNRHRRECQAVLAQLRQMEEKRNPSMAN